MTAKKATLVGNFHHRIGAAVVGSLGCALTRRGQDEREQPRALLAVSTAILSERPDRSTATLPERAGASLHGRNGRAAKLVDLVPGLPPAPPTQPGDCQ